MTTLPCYSRTSSKNTPAVVQSVGQLLPGILARYGIVMTATELDAFRVSARKESSRRKLDKTPERYQPRQELPKRQDRSDRVEANLNPFRRNKMVQLPLFPLVDRRAIDGFAVR